MENGPNHTAGAAPGLSRKTPLRLPAALREVQESLEQVGPRLVAISALATVATAVVAWLTIWLLVSASGPRLAGHGVLGLPPLALTGLILLAELAAAFAAVAFAVQRTCRPAQQALETLPQGGWELVPEGITTELKALRHHSTALQQELDALAKHRESLTTEVDRLLANQKSAMTTLNAAVSMTQDFLILTDPDGRIRDISATTLELLDIGRPEVLGKPFTEVVRLYDPSKSKPRESPLDSLVAKVTKSRSTIPRLEEALLVNRRDQERKVLVSAAAILERETDLVGALVRIDTYRAGKTETAREAAPAASSVTTDPDTGLPNRLAFERRIDELIKIARAQRSTHALMLLSPDTLQQVNDQHGHWAGEQLLWQMARILRETVPPQGDCFRISGAHFAVLMPFTPAAEAAHLAERIRVAIEGREFKWQEFSFEATVSIGVVAIPPDAEGYKVLLGMANRVLGAAKAENGNAVQVQTPDQPLLERRKQDREWVAWLGRRLKGGYAHLISQAIEPLALGPAGQPLLEVLLRIEDEDGAWVNPGTFLPSVVRHNLTAQIDVWLLRRVLAVLAKDPALLSQYECVTVNLARSSLTEADFAERIAEALAESSVSARHVCFEIDALTSINHPSDVNRFVTTVQATGARFALDRCKAALGLQALTTLPIEFVKIHMALIHRAASNPMDRAYVNWINEAAHQLDRRTIATGVEDEATLKMLRELGIDYAQGIQINKLGPLMA